MFSLKKSIQSLLQNIIFGINDNAIEVNPFIIPYTCLQHIKF